MSTRTVELVSEWDSVPFAGGYDGLRTLSDQGFSGAVTAGPAQLFMLNGTVVGVLDGDIEAFEDAAGTARAAPHDALPLLAVMQDRAGEPRAQYYTEETAISEVDRTLSDGNFTGYVELSENVLSGDYYLVYHQGRSMNVAWVGSGERLVTDEEAFEQADGEVGIYQVIPAAIEPVELPEPPAPEPSSEPPASEPTPEPDAPAEESTPQATADDTTDGETASAERQATADDTTDGATGAESTHVTANDDADESETTAESGDEPSDSGAERSRTGPPGSKAAGASQGTAVDQHRRAETTEREQTGESAVSGERADAETRAETAVDDREPTDGETDASERTAEPQSTPEQVDETGEKEPAAQRAADVAAETAAQAEASEPADSHESAPPEPQSDERTQSSSTATQERGATAADSDGSVALETRSIPSLDPERSRTAPEEPTGESSPVSEPAGSATEPAPAQNEPAAAESPSPAEAQRRAAATAELEAELDERERDIAQLESELGELSARNEELASERDRLLAELEDARDEIQRLEEQLEADGGAAAGSQLSAAEAIDGTNLFVRYHSKGEATLASAQEGSADRAAVEENLRLEYHTQFDSEDAVVDGEPFAAFLQDSIHYRFVDWLVRSLLYEIRDTGHQSAMGVLYDALPKVDRAELNGKVSVTYTEDGQEHRSQERFDVVVRDRMGNPLVIANINDSRQPATDGQMTDIVRNAERVGDASDSLAATFLVTSSFFEPEALETAEEATSSGLFSRDKRKSFVNLSRKGGYHLCLLEARNREFHLAVPEL